MSIYKQIKCLFTHRVFFIRNNNLYCKQCGNKVVKAPKI